MQPRSSVSSFSIPCLRTHVSEDSRLPRVQFLRFGDQILVEIVPITSIVDPPVAVRTECDDILRVVCPTITAPPKMMYLEERVSTISEKRGIVITALTHTVSDSERVFSHDFRRGYVVRDRDSLVVRPSPFTLASV